jgi:hypothetical protein
MIGRRRLLWATIGLLADCLRTATPSTTRLTGRQRWIRSTPDAHQSEHIDALIIAHKVDRDVGEASRTLNRGQLVGIQVAVVDGLHFGDDLAAASADTGVNVRDAIRTRTHADERTRT